MAAACFLLITNSRRRRVSSGKHSSNKRSIQCIELTKPYRIFYLPPLIFLDFSHVTSVQHTGLVKLWSLKWALCVLTALFHHCSSPGDVILTSVTWRLYVSHVMLYSQQRSRAQILNFHHFQTLPGCWTN